MADEELKMLEDSKRLEYFERAEKFEWRVRTGVKGLFQNPIPITDQEMYQWHLGIEGLIEDLKKFQKEVNKATLENLVPFDESQYRR